MKQALLFHFLFCWSFFSVYAQDAHWGAVVLEGDSFSYLIPNSQLPSQWKELSYNDNSWSSGNSGFGYGDNDDLTILPNQTTAVFIRKKISITDPNTISQIVFYIDYDDGFVAYLNGTEIARKNMSGNEPTFDQLSDALHEASLYQNQTLEQFVIDKSLLVAGDNLLAIQVHNESATSSDLSAIPFLFVETTSSSDSFRPTPEWFVPPLQFTSSHLPIVVVDTRGATIVDDPKREVNIGVIYNGEGITNHITDPFNEYEGTFGMEIRGESSQAFEKKSYLIESHDLEGNDIDISFLGFPKEEDFILYAPYSDKSLFNNVLIMNLASKMGHYASRTRFVELVINNDYKGVYVLMEKIKRDKNRVDISKLNPDENEGDDLTGGYIFRIDKGEHEGWLSRHNIYGSMDRKIFFQYYYPDQEAISPTQSRYISQYMHDFEDAIASNDGQNSQNKHYSEYIDLDSFVDNFILNEFSKNVDAYRLSTYFHKDKESKGGKVKAGPFWDYNLSLGNADYCNVEGVEGWIYYECSGNNPFWWHKLLNDTIFQTKLNRRWTELRTNILSESSLLNYIDSLSQNLEEPINRNFNRWPILGQYIWPNSDFYRDARTHAEVIQHMKNWISGRLQWIDQNIPEVIIVDPEIPLSSPDVSIHLTLYPNPTKNKVWVYSPDGVTEIHIHNIVGKKLKKMKFQAQNDFVIDLSPYQMFDVLFLVFKTSDSQSISKKIFIK